jgi:hypothetical protein
LSSPLSPLPDGFAATVASLHLVAERLVAPARKPENEIALEPVPGGFGTPEFEFEGARQRVRVDGTELVREVDDAERRTALTSLAAAAPLLDGLLPADAELDDEPLELSPAAAAALAGWYRFGDQLLGALAAAAAAPDGASAPILWPEHFDVAIELGAEATGERATYGLSPGDGDHPEPYLYVATWRPGLSGELWQATGFTGAELGYAELIAAPDQREAALAFFEERRRALRQQTP